MSLNGGVGPLDYGRRLWLVVALISTQSGLKK